MKRPHSWLRWLLLGCLLVVLGQYLALSWLAPRYVMRAVERAAGGRLLAGQVWLSLPATTTFTDLRFANNTQDAALSIQRATTKLQWISLPARTVWFELLEIERPVIRVTRTSDGAVRWPSVPPPPAPLADP